MRYGVIETVVAKLTGPLPQAPAARLTYADQGFGFSDGTGFNPARSALGSDSHEAMVERGRYLFTVGSCALCHTNDGSGRLKVSWKPFGTLWSRNLTSDRDTGLGAWTDAQISRAIRSGSVAVARYCIGKG